MHSMLHLLFSGHNGQPTLYLVCSINLWAAQKGLSMFDMDYQIIQRLHTSVCRHWILHDNIFRRLHTFLYKCQTWTSNIVCSLYTSECWNLIWIGNIVCSLQDVSMFSKHKKIGMHVSNVECAHLSSDVSLCPGTLYKASTHKCGLCTSEKRGRRIECNKSEVVHTSTISCAHRFCVYSSGLRASARNHKM